MHFSPESDIRVTHRSDPVCSYMFPDVQQKKPHFHNQCELIMAISGSANFHVSGQEYALAPGSILCISNLENHSISSSTTDYSRYTVRLSNEALSTLIRDPVLISIFKQRPEGFCHLYTCTLSEASYYIKTLDHMLREYAEQRPYWEHMVASRLMGILVCMYRRTPQAFPATRKQAGQNLIFDVQNYIESHISGDLQLETVASRFFISKFHLSHSFPAITGYTFKRYVLMTRLSRAKELLLYTDQEIRSIAEAVGFSSASHFIRIFKANEGLSPLQYRSRARNRE